MHLSSSGAYHETKDIMVISNEPGIITSAVILEMKEWTLRRSAFYLKSSFISREEIKNDKVKLKFAKNFRETSLNVDCLTETHI